MLKMFSKRISSSLQSWTKTNDGKAIKFIENVWVLAGFFSQNTPYKVMGTSYMLVHLMRVIFISDTV